MHNISPSLIATISVIPFAAIGGGGYIGYQYFYGTSPVNNHSTTKDYLSVDLEAQKIELKNGEVQLKTHESLLESEEAKKAKLEAELLHFEVALLRKQKEDLESKKADFVRDEQAKSKHSDSISSLTQQKDDAEQVKTTKQGLVDAKQTEIQTATNNYNQQKQLEDRAKQTKESSDNAYQQADKAHSLQATKEATAQQAFDKNAEDIQKLQTSLATETPKKTPLENQKTEADKKVSEGKIVCDQAIQGIEPSTTCDKAIEDNLQNVTITEALGTYKSLLDSLKSIKDELSTLQGKIDCLTNQLSEEQQKTANLQTTLNQEKAATKNLKQQKDSANLQKTTDTEAYETAKKQTSSLEAIKQEKESELSQLSSDLDAANHTFNGFVNQLTELNKQTQNINNKYTQSKKSLEKIIGSVRAKEETLKITTSKLEELTNEINAKSALLDASLASSLEIEQKNTTQLTKSINTYKMEIRFSTTKINSLKEQISNFKSYISSISSEIDKTSEEISNTDSSSR